MVTVIGAGLAGCEAAWTLASNGIDVELHEMKPQKFSPAHHYAGFAELVCSNSLKAERIGTAGGLLKAEMRLMGSILLECADMSRVPAGGSLAVDREKFSDAVTERIRANPRIKIIEREMAGIPQGHTIIATGPLTSDALAASVREMLGGEYLSFYDAAAPIVEANSLDWDKVFKASRYDRGDDDYVNCPFNKEEYEAFHMALMNAETAELKAFEKEKQKIYEGCMPVEVMAKRGADTLRYGPMKPVGLRDPNTGHRPWAVVQLRNENAGGTLLNLVGFQTNLKFAEQKRVFSMIPGLENAEFVRFGVMHRNTFIDSPRLLNADFSLKSKPDIAFAGQITGVEGYMESAASGIIAAQSMIRRLRGQKPLILPRDTMTGALSAYISDGTVTDFQPMGANMGILPPLDAIIKGKKERYEALAERAEASLRHYLREIEWSVAL